VVEVNVSDDDVVDVLAGDAAALEGGEEQGHGEVGVGVDEGGAVAWVMR
jgi:hypothetical protein